MHDRAVRGVVPPNGWLVSCPCRAAGCRCAALLHDVAAMLDIDIGSAVQLEPDQTEQHGRGCDQGDEPEADRAVLASMMRHGDRVRP